MKTPLCALLLAFVATATACVPHPPAHGPVPAPGAVEVDPPRLVASLRRDFPGATVDPSTPRRIVRVRLGEVAAVGDPRSFAKGILERHQGELGYLELSNYTSFHDGPLFVVEQNATAPRDTGCRRVRFRVGFDDGRAVFVERECRPFEHRPPSYRARPLPSTATGDVEILARKGPFGGHSATAFSGVVLDRYGDVYTAVDRGSFESSDYELLDYVRTLPPAEVEQFMYDVALSRSSSEESPSGPPSPDEPSHVIDGFLAKGQAVSLAHRRGFAASRARAWAEDNLHE